MDIAVRNFQLWIFAIFCVFVFIFSFAAPTLHDRDSQINCSNLGEFSTGFQSLISVAPVVDVFFALRGKGNSIIGVSDGAKRILDDGLISKIYPEFKTIPTISKFSQSLFGVSDEALIYLAPDFMFVPVGASGRINNIGIPYTEIGAVRTLEDEFARWKCVASFTRQEILFEKVRNTALKELHYLADEAFAGKDRMNGVFLWFGEDSAIYIAGVNSRLAIDFDHMIGKYGYSGSYMARLNLESLLVIDPDVIFVPPWGSGYDSKVFYADDRYKVIRAVMNRRVYAMPIGVSRIEGLVEYPMVIRWMKDVVYPSKNGISFRDYILSKFRDAYGYEMTDQDIDAFLRMKENASSANYDQFKAPVSH